MSKPQQLPEILESVGTLSSTDAASFSDTDWKIVEQVKSDLAKAFNSKQIRQIGEDIQKQLTSKRSELLDSLRSSDAGTAGQIINDVVATSHEITRVTKLSPMVSGLAKKFNLAKGKHQTVARQLDDLTTRVDSTLVNLHTSQEILEEVLGSLSETVHGLQPVIYALTEDVIRGSNSLQLISEQTPEALQFEYILSEKQARLRDLQIQSVIAKQQIQQCMITRQASATWINELEYAAGQIIPLYQTSVMQSIGMRAAKQAASLHRTLRSAADKMLLSTAKDLQSNVSSLQQAHIQGILDVKTVEEAQRILEATMNSIADTRRISLAETSRSIESLQQLSNGLREVNVNGNGDFAIN